MTMKLTSCSWVLGHSCLSLLVCSHSSLIGLLQNARFTHAIRCTHLLDRSLQSSWERDVCLWVGHVDFIQFQPIVRSLCTSRFARALRYAHSFAYLLTHSLQERGSCLPIECLSTHCAPRLTMQWVQCDLIYSLSATCRNLEPPLLLYMFLGT